MATYTELRKLFQGSEDSDILRNRINVAVSVSAEELLAGTPTLEQQKWAANVFSNPAIEGNKAFIAVVVKNRTFTIAQITGATDEVLQASVDSVVPSLVVAYNAV